MSAPTELERRFHIVPTGLEGLSVLVGKPVGDHRGSLQRLFCSSELAALLGSRTIVQINHTTTEKRGTVRGMHFQKPPFAETKFVTCLRGEVFDVAVDLRRNSPTFLKWHAEHLGGGTHKTLLIPEGFAHGFQTLTDECELLYFHTFAHSSSAEGGVNPRDPSVGIDWPAPITDISNRDSSRPMLDSGFPGLAV